MRNLLATILRGGVMLAAGVVLLGAVIYLWRHGAETPHYHVFQGEPSELRSVAGTITAAAGLSGRGLIQLGILVLIATPILRVAASLVAFTLERDRTYVVVTGMVLTLLLYSLLGGG